MATIAIAPMAAHVDQVMADPAAFGFANAEDGYMLVKEPSEPVEQFVFWDDEHFTTAVHTQLAAQFVMTVQRNREHEQLVAIEDIRQLKARYFRYLDLKDWLSLEALFIPDVVVDFRTASGQAPDETAVFHGVERFITFAQEALNQVTTIHHGYMPEISIISPVRAYGIWAMEDILIWPSECATPRQRIHGYGHYEDIYEQTEGQWRIKDMKLTRLWIDFSTAL